LSKNRQVIISNHSRSKSHFNTY